MQKKYRLGYCEWHEDVPYYTSIINEVGYVEYIFNKQKYKDWCFFGKTERLLSDPNYLGFRNGPIPGISNYKKRCWQKYLGNHNESPKGEYLYDISTFEFSDNLSKDYGLRIKIRRRRSFFVKYNTWEYDSYHEYTSYGRGWKKTRKKKQWM